MDKEKPKQPKNDLARKLNSLADTITSKMMKFADDIESHFEDAAEAVDPKTLAKRRKEKKKD